MAKRGKFSKEEINFVKQNAHDKSIEDLAKYLDRKPKTVKRLLGTLNLSHGDMSPEEHDKVSLKNRLHEKDHYVTIETAGTIFKEDVKADLFSISPKLKNSFPSKEEYPKEFKIHTKNNTFDQNISPNCMISKHCQRIPNGRIPRNGRCRNADAKKSNASFLLALIQDPI